MFRFFIFSLVLRLIINRKNRANGTLEVPLLGRFLPMLGNYSNPRASPCEGDVIRGAPRMLKIPDFCA